MQPHDVLLAMDALAKMQSRRHQLEMSHDMVEFERPHLVHLAVSADTRQACEAIADALALRAKYQQRMSLEPSPRGEKILPRLALADESGWSAWDAMGDACLVRRQGVCQVEVHGTVLVPEPPLFKSFLEDCATLSALVNMGPLVSFAYTRLKLLEHRYGRKKSAAEDFLPFSDDLFINQVRLQSAAQQSSRARVYSPRSGRLRWSRSAA